MIGRTLFWYIFRDLLKIFVLANAALAGIMSFGGLLRPLTHQGLDAVQVGKLLGYSNMAMLTYSLPIAALFATTVVYGRLSADNELTGVRAGGVSHLSISLPAFVLGVLVAILSLVFLCFIVPIYTLKAEQTVYSNMARLIAGRIQSTHQIRFGSVTIFAQDAWLPPDSSKYHGQQVVVLKGPTIESVIKPYRDQRDYRVPKDFYTASEADLYIERREHGEQRGTGRVYLTMRLLDGVKFPREVQGNVEAGVLAADYGPTEIESPIKEDTKFMNVWRLKKLYHDPAESARVKRLLADFVIRDQQIYMARRMAADLNDSNQEIFRFPDGEKDFLRRDPTAPPAVASGGELFLPAAPPAAQTAAWVAAQSSADILAAATGSLPIPAIPIAPESDSRPVSFQKIAADHPSPMVTARQAHVQIRPTDEPDTMRLNIEMIDVVHHVGSELAPTKSFIQPLDVPLDAGARAIAARGVNYYARRDPDREDRRHVGRELLALSNQILAESNSRVSFAISCLVLVMVGCALGMMFRSGNFLSGFAVSFVPALLTLTLIVAGQRVSGSVPDVLKTDVARYVNTPLRTGLSLIWAGNCLNCVLAVALLGRLQRK